MARRLRILCIDGGGIRGIIPGQVLVEVERRVMMHLGPEARLCDAFDFVAGTSTGGILASVYLCPQGSRPRFTAAQAVELYLQRGGEIFKRPVAHQVLSLGGLVDERYPATGLLAACDTYFGDLRLSDLLKPCLVTAYDIKRRRAYFFTQHDARKSLADDFLLRDVVRATSAAPTYFEPAQIYSQTGVPYPLVDGGVFANNPALCAYAEARHKLPGKPRARDMLIVSLGTGSSLKPYRYEEVRDYGLFRWARPTLDIMMSGVSETVDYQLARMFEAAGVPGQYLRLDADLEDEPNSVSDLDNAAPENMLRLQQIGQELAEQRRDDLDRFVETLCQEAARPEA
ncbi:MAG TPA: patatin-like phospholipase family protein [Polyangiaceae bacterium]|nr:patatin-like phospholipase family protein [Polyangiaceae bacterium]